MESPRLLPHGCYFSRKRKASETDRKLPFLRRVHLWSVKQLDVDPYNNGHYYHFNFYIMLLYIHIGAINTQESDREKGSLYRILKVYIGDIPFCQIMALPSIAALHYGWRGNWVFSDVTPHDSGVETQKLEQTMNVKKIFKYIFLFLVSLWILKVCFSF